MQFLQSGTKESFLAMRAALVGAETYAPYDDGLDSINSLMQAQKYAEAKDRIAQSMPDLLLSPQAHLMNSFILGKEGNEKGAEMEMAIARSCVDGILSTGDGTEASPYLVTRSSDVYDVLQFLQKEPSGQGLIHEGGRSFDRMECADGSVLWFDITDSFKTLEKKFSDEEKS